MPRVRRYKTLAEENVRQHVTQNIHHLFDHLDATEKSHVLDWTQKAQMIYEDHSMTPVERLKAFYALDNRQIAETVMMKHDLVRKFGMSQSQIKFATLGAGIGFSLVMMTPAGGVLLDAAIDELKGRTDRPETGKFTTGDVG